MKGEVSKSGAAVLPSKRTRKIPEKIAAREEPEKIEEDETKDLEQKKDEDISSEDKSE